MIKNGESTMHVLCGIVIAIVCIQSPERIKKQQRALHLSLSNHCYVYMMFKFHLSSSYYYIACTIFAQCIESEGTYVEFILSRKKVQGCADV